jgi:ribonucleoside-diphosphate reductase beta chain
MAPTSDPLLTATNDRFCLFPVKHDDLWEFYKKAQASYWTAEGASARVLPGTA